MKIFWVGIFLLLATVVVYWPHAHAQFILDDYYTIVRNPLIKNPSLYKDILSAHLFDAHQSSSYIKFGYYRPVLEFSWVLDYRLFGLKAYGYQWVNLLIHAVNCFLIFGLVNRLFAPSSWGLKTALLFCVLPTHEWSVRYITSRGDLLSCCFALLSLLALLNVLKTHRGYVFVFLFWFLAALSREVALFYFLYGFLIYFQYQNKIKSINQFGFYWLLWGMLPLALIWPLIPKLGNILVLHFLYFASIGFCLVVAQWRWQIFLTVVMVMAGLSCYQGRFWSTEEALLRHTHCLEIWPNTVAHQQLLMKYDEDTKAIEHMVTQAQEPPLKALWLKRLGGIYFSHGNFLKAENYFNQALKFDPSNADILDDLAIVHRDQGDEAGNLKYLQQALSSNPNYPDTLKGLGIYYYTHHQVAPARFFLNRCLFFDPNDAQVKQLLANSMN